MVGSIFQNLRNYPIELKKLRNPYNSQDVYHLSYTAATVILTLLDCELQYVITCFEIIFSKLSALLQNKKYKELISDFW